ncbi:malto-oligosyltrehalose synthase [Thiohalomonas denitrificans]|uniref:(1->4)-alpha-D-glucan 1-alpha-D-glucosylmutase n=1 Tax=Thiohalomonas denitrificans TaxID=415747 RepID=A0A1G5QQQ6_9GAMM|nr:malto-oligosyltrehalose synthase [Thiohalomonas denitrificans]SCZ63439.1 (1->4)-alpha-D-glucan 1-alpha-D-glucosylmutase [Thiohalomonas denitrificans]
MAEQQRIPLSTYRLQFNREFTFADAARLVPYLDRLGVSHAYASPYLKARAGSSHGYDIVDHSELNPEIGDGESFHHFVNTLHDHGMGQILDLVPNHMAIFGNDNAWWLDVLENGPTSAYAMFFDIDWRPIKEVLRGKVLIPVLGDHYGQVLEDGQLTLEFEVERGEFSVWYWEHRFPIDPATYPVILESGMEDLSGSRSDQNPALQDLQALITSFGHLPARWDQSGDRLAERRRDKEIHKRHLAELCHRAPEIAEYVNACVERFNGTAGKGPSFDALHRLLEQQAYRLAFWQVASDDINYRRFFDINELAGLRQEEPVVFEHTHHLVLQLMQDGSLDGVRIDHPDGLYDPADYYRQLQKAGSRALSPEKTPTVSPVPPFYLVVEKILGTHEHLPDDWPVHGTTGYDFANLLSGLLVFPDSENELTRLYNRFTGNRREFDELLFEKKKLVIKTQLSSELAVLANMLDQIAQHNRYTRDFTLNGLRNALMVIVASFPVYRTYVSGSTPLKEEDRRYIDWAVAWAKKRSPATDISIFDFAKDVLLGEETMLENEELRRQALAFTMKFQQYTAPVMAKGMEDTAFYVYNRLISLNEVGGDPRRFCLSVSAFHHTNAERLQHWPATMLSTSTHDTKRSEDVRARINVISELPNEWQRHVSRWSRLNRTKKMMVDDESAPSRNDEYFLYQTLVGAWPLHLEDNHGLEAFRGRIRDYMLKAVKEAKVHTSWINPNEEYEKAVVHFVESLLSDTNNRFLSDFQPFVERVSRFGLFNSLSQVTLKLTSPGVPDIYQGNELWEFALVDPDNRHPVDYALRKRLLDDLIGQRPNTNLARDLMDHIDDGRIKLFITWRLLTLRRRFPRLFLEGEYTPLATEGAMSEHLCAFAREDRGQWLVVVVPRWFTRLMTDSNRPTGELVWIDTQVEWPFKGRFRNWFTDEVFETESDRIPAADLIHNFPAAVLISGAENT